MNRPTKLARSNAELEQFAYVASHDLQEPLRKIQAFGDRLKTKYERGLGPEGLDYLTRMQNAAARMQTLIQDLLSLSRVASHAKPFTPVDLGDVVRMVVSDLEMRIQDASGRVEDRRPAGGLRRSRPNGAVVPEPDRQRNEVPKAG